jgi:hypothetical protein
LQLPAFVREPFSAAMSESVLLPAFVALFGIVAALFLIGFAPGALARASQSADSPGRPDDDVEDYDDDDYVEFILHEPERYGRPSSRR